jgi:hypothetical protein
MITIDEIVLGILCLFNLGKNFHFVSIGYLLPGSVGVVGNFNILRAATSFAKMQVPGMKASSSSSSMTQY